MRSQWFYTTALCHAALFGITEQAAANPQGGQIKSGDARIKKINANKLEIHQSSHRAVINWDSFDIKADQHTQLKQPSKTSHTLNRVTGTTKQASQILGKLSANGKVTLVNPNGIFIGKNAQIDVSGLITTTADIKNSDFMADKHHFTQPGNPDAQIINHGQITAKQAGLVGLVAPHIENHGIIEAKTVQFASGDIAMDLYGDGLMAVQASDAIKQQVIKNTGTITGNMIQITAAKARESIDTLIHIGGELKAPVVNKQNGLISIRNDSSGGRLEITGTLDAGNSTGTGGIIAATAEKISVSGTIKADGQTGGGQVNIGGDYLGGTTAKKTTSGLAIKDSGGKTLYIAKREAPLPPAQLVKIEKTALVTANATGYSGRGGNVIVWSDDHTSFKGAIEVKGHTHTTGGFVETSGKNTLHVSGQVTAPGGEWLLDPRNVTITNGTQSNGSFNSGSPNTYNPVGDNATVDVNNIATALNGGTSVTIATGVTGAQAGNITWSANADLSVTPTADTTLTLNAASSILLNGNNTDTLNISAAGSHKLNLHLLSDNDGDGTGNVRIRHTNINTNNGDIWATGGTDPFNTITPNDLTDSRATGYTSNSVGVLVSASSIINAGSGNITLSGKGATDLSSGTNRGILINSSTINSTGITTLYGTGGTGTHASIGITVENNSVLNTDTLNIAGFGGTGAYPSNAGNNYGVQLNNSTFNIDSILTVNGTGGNGDSNDNASRGIQIENGMQILSASGANFDFTGTGGSGGNSQDGIIVFNNNTAKNIVISTSGNITFTGTGGSGQNSINGTEISSLTSSPNNNVVINAGNLSITGTGGAASGNIARGVFIGDEVALNVTDQLVLNGTGGTANSNTRGIDIGGNSNALNNGVAIQAGSATLMGTAGNSSTEAHGIVLFDEVDISTSGNLTLTGQGGSNASSTTNRAITINGNNVDGLYLNSMSGNITLTAEAPQAGTAQYGITFVNDSHMSSDTGNIFINAGTGATSQDFATFFNPSVIGDNNMSGNITIIADSYRLDNLSFETTGNITYAPKTAGRSIGLNGATCGGSCHVNFTNNNFLSSIINANQVTFGDNNTGFADIANLWDISSYVFDIGVIGQTIDAGGITTSVGQNIGLESTVNNINLANSWTLGGNLILESNGSIVSNADIDTTGNNQELTFKARDGISITNDIIASNGAANITLNADSDANQTGGVVISNAIINSLGGDITIGGGVNATDFAYGEAINSAGVQFDNATVISGDGSIIAKGNGFDGVNNRYGVYATNNTRLESTGSGNITLIGQGGNGANFNDGIRISDNNGATILTENGNIVLTGASDVSTGTGNRGLFITDTSLLRTTGIGDIILTGTSRATGNNAQGGAVIRGNTVVEATGSGNIQIIGQGSVDAGGDSNYGVEIRGTSTVINTNTGNLSITGTGGTGINNNHGFYTLGGSEFTALGGNISINGIGGNGTGNSNRGVYASTDTQIHTINNGNITINGTGGAGNTTALGISINNGADISVKDGLLELIGNSTNSTGSSQIGISVNNSGTNLSATGSGSITLRGSIGNNSINSNRAVQILDNANLTTSTGNISVYADSINTDTGLIFNTQGNLIFAPTTNGSSIGINSATGQVLYANSLFDRIGNAGQVIFGTNDTGAVNTVGTIDLSSHNFGLTLNGSGHTLGNINTGVNTFKAVAYNNDITLNGILSSTAANDAIVLAASNGRFINNTGSNVFNIPNGHYNVYTGNPANNTLNGFTPTNKRYDIAFSDDISAFNGNYFFYDIAPVLTITPTNQTYTYSGNNQFNSTAYTINGFIDGDDASDLTGSAIVSANQTVHAGIYDINSSAGNLANDNGYTFNFATVGNALTINKADLTLIPVAQNYTYNGLAQLNETAFTITGFVNNETADVLTGTGRVLSSGNVVNVGQYDLTTEVNTLSAANYNFVTNNLANGLGIAKAALIIDVDNKTRPKNQSNPEFTYVVNGLKHNDTEQVINNIELSTTADRQSPVGTYAITAQGAMAANYDFVYQNGVLRIVSGTQPSQRINIPDSVLKVSQGTADAVRANTARTTRSFIQNVTDPVIYLILKPNNLVNRNIIPIVTETVLNRLSPQATDISMITMQKALAQDLGYDNRYILY